MKIVEVIDGNTASFTPTANRTGYTKGVADTVRDNLDTQALTTRTKSGTTLLVF